MEEHQGGWRSIRRVEAASCPLTGDSDVPKVSTMGSFLTIALFFTIRITPSANVTVTTMGKPSGMAATARLGESTGTVSVGGSAVRPTEPTEPTEHHRAH